MKRLFTDVSNGLIRDIYIRKNSFRISMSEFDLISNKYFKILNPEQNFMFNVEIFLNEYFIKFYLLVPSILMISNIPTFSLKGIKFEKKLIPLVIILLASFLSLLITDFWLAMIILISVYFLSIPLAFYDFKKS